MSINDLFKSATNVTSNGETETYNGIDFKVFELTETLESWKELVKKYSLEVIIWVTQQTKSNGALAL